MERSIKRILTTHVGSLIRPQPLQEILRARRNGMPINESEYAECLRNSVAEVVRLQVKAGIDIVDDGEYGKDRKSTRLNSSHSSISYAVFCLKKKKNTHY